MATSKILLRYTDNPLKLNLRVFLPQLAQSGLMVPGTPGYRSRPTEADRMHCVAFVISARAFSAMHQSVGEKFKDVLNEARARRKTYQIYITYFMFNFDAGLQSIVILTQIDRVCSSTEKSTKNVFHSNAVKQKVCV